MPLALCNSCTMSSAPGAGRKIRPAPDRSCTRGQPSGKGTDPGTGTEEVKSDRINFLRPLCACRVLQKCLSRSLTAMHRARSRVLLHAVEALITGRRPTLMDVARSWPGAERVRAPLKAFDRLLSNL